MTSRRAGLSTFAALWLGVLCLLEPGAARADVDEQVRAAYPKAIATWASGEREAALAMVEEMETSLLTHKRSAKDVEAMWRSKLGVIRDLILRSSNEVLPSIVALHHDMFLHYRRRKPVLARHSVEMSMELAEYYNENSSNPEAALFASDALTSLGGHLQDGFLMTRAAELFARAELAFPRGVGAQLGMGAMYERRGELEQALEYYARSVANAPGDPEAQLRHGIVASRMGDRRRAEKSLALVQPPEASDWMRRVAMEELVRLAVNADERRSRSARLGEAFPSASRVAIQRSFLAEQQKNTGRALQLLGNLPSEPEAESERYRYSRWPRSAIDEGRERMAKVINAMNAELVLAASNFAQ